MSQQITHPITLAQTSTTLTVFGSRFTVLDSRFPIKRLVRTALRRNLLVVSGLVVVAATVLYFAGPVAAANIVWNGAGLDENWSNGANWVGGSPPGNADVAVFDGTSAKPATINTNFNVAGVQINPTYLGTITQAPGVTLDVGFAGYTQGGSTFQANGTVNFTFSPFALSGGTFDAGAGTVNIHDGPCNLTGGQFIAPASTMTFTGGSASYSRSGTASFLHNGGTVIFGGAGTWQINGGAAGTENYNNLTVNNTSGFSLTISSEDTLRVTGTLSLTRGGPSGGTLQAEGNVSIANTFTSGNSILLIVGPPRTVTIPTGLSGPFMTTKLNSAGTILNTSGPGAVTIPALTLQAGTIETGASDFAINNNYMQSGGAFNGGTGSVTFNIAVVFTLTAGTFNGGMGTVNFRDNNITLTGGQFVAPSGTMAFLEGASNSFTRNDPATFEHNGGTVVILGGAQVTWRINGGAAGTDVLNNLTINTSNNFNIDTQDTLRVVATLALMNGFANGGTLQAEGAVSVASAFDGGTTMLTFSGSANQSFTNNGGVNPTGPWTVNKSAGFLTLASDLTLQPGQQLNITSGILDQGASFNLTAGPITIGPAGRLRNHGTGDLTLRGNITNNGTLTLNGGGGGCTDPDSILIRSDPDGTSRTWAGTGNFFLTDVDVKDQSAANPPVISVFNGTDSGNNSNFTFEAACSPSAAPAHISGQITDAAGAPLGGVLLTLTGATGVRRTITNSEGFYQFSDMPADSFYSVTPMRANYAFAPRERSFSLLANKTDAVFTGRRRSETANPLDTPEFFVRQNYLDFLGREPEQGGLDYWSGELRACSGDQRASSRRVGVSARSLSSRNSSRPAASSIAFTKRRWDGNQTLPSFRWIETKWSVAIRWQSSRRAFADEWVTRDSFRQLYPASMSAGDFVNRLFDTAGLQPYTAERQQQIEVMAAGRTRAQVLREVIEIGRVQEARVQPVVRLDGILRLSAPRSGSWWLRVLAGRAQQSRAEQLSRNGLRIHYVGGVSGALQLSGKSQ